MRGDSHLIICRYGSTLDGIRSIAFLAKGFACSSVCRLSFGSDIHSRMIFRRASCSGFMLKILCSKWWSKAAYRPDCDEEREVRMLRLEGAASIAHDSRNHSRSPAPITFGPIS